jgi:hypothetical protein
MLLLTGRAFYQLGGDWVLTLQAPNSERVEPES